MIRRTARPGFTLVELLVAMSLAVVILALAIGVSQSTAFDSYKTVGAADKLSQFMIVAKNKALRDKAPRGIRFLVDPTTGHSREIAYIEQPDPWVPPPSASLMLVYKTTGSPPSAVVSRQAFLSGVTLAEMQSAIQPGDILSVREIGAFATVSGFVAPTNPATDPVGATVEILFAPVAAAAPDNVPLPNLGAAHSPTPSSPPLNFVPTYQTRQFTFLRQPRPLLGEPTQQFPSGMVVDFDVSPTSHPLTRSTTAPNPFPAQFDLLFSPSGEVIAAQNALMVFVMRDATIRPATPPTALNLRSDTQVAAAGQLILVCLYAKTGAISTQPINPAPPSAPATFDPYQFAKDGLNTGL